MQKGKREPEEPTWMRGARLGRRSFLQAGMAAGAAGMGLSSRAGSLIERALKSSSNGTGISDIQHVVILMQENRSFDHYFGTLSGVRGFSVGPVLEQTVGGKTYPIFDQFGYEPGVGVSSSGYLQPFHLKSDPPSENGQTTNDISHSWGPQHQSWDSGAMDAFITAHLAADGDSNGPVTMGYFTRKDLAFYYALADAFTICDGYYCSVLGPTDPNRVMSISATIDPAGVAGGPCLVTQTSERQAQYGTFTWTTMPEQLSAAGITWKVYNDPTALLELSPFPYFKTFVEPSTPAETEMAAQALSYTYPASFAADVAAGTLPVGFVDHAPVGRMRAPSRTARVRGIPCAADLRDARVEPRCLEPDGVRRHLRRERRILRPHASSHAACRNRRGIPDCESPAGRRFRNRRTRGSRIPGAVSGDLAVQQGRVHVLAHLGPHFDPSVLRDTVRGRGTEPVVLAQVGDRRHDRSARPDTPTRHIGSEPACDLSRGHHRRRTGGDQCSGRNRRRWCGLPTSNFQQNANSGDDSGTPSRSALTDPVDRYPGEHDEPCARKAVCHGTCAGSGPKSPVRGSCRYSTGG